MVFSSIVEQQQQEHRIRQQSQEFPREKKLDLNAPLLSVRRHHQQERWGANQRNDSSPHATKDDDDDQGACWGSLRSPGAVPFVWERTPGRPKLESRSNLSGDFAARNSCSSPSLPPGRTWTKSPSPAQPVFSPASTRTDSHLQKQQRQRVPSPVVDVKAQQPRLPSSKLPALPKDSPHKKHRQLGELFKRRSGGDLSACESDEEQLDQDQVDVFSDALQSENLTLDPPAFSRSKASLPGDDPAARDFILRRFLPAAKAMANESTASTPFSSPLVSSSTPTNHHGNHSRPTNLSSSSALSPSSPRKQVAASVERIQTYQYKFASGSDKNNRREDFFALGACGFFSLTIGAALRHLRPQYPSSRLRRSSDRAHNRFATDDFHTSIFVKKVNGGLTIRHEDEVSETETEDDRKSPRLKLNHQPRKTDWSKLESPRRLLKSPKSYEKFYDCDSHFGNKPRVSPEKLESSSYYRGAVSPLPEKVQTKGFLGLPENYTPPDDPYRHVGYSPSVIDKNRVTELASPAARLGKLTADDKSAPPPSPGWKKRQETRESSNHQETSNLFAAYGESTKKGVHWGRPPLKVQQSESERPTPIELPLQSPGRSNAVNSPAALLPPKSPSHSWLWKALPMSPSMNPEEKNANWEATVKSRKMRPGHLWLWFSGKCTAAL